jgi:CheY-like chemotaxis protein
MRLPMANIFLVDDDFASELIVENLRQRGHTVSRLADADSAMANSKEIAASDLVVLDLVMPRSEKSSGASATDGARSTGMSVFTELRRLRHDLPILVFTANQDPALVDVIKADAHARFVSRWSAPGFSEFIGIVHQMLGTAPDRPLPLSLIVHGRDETTKLEVKNFLQNTLGLPEPIILHERPNLGRTLIEKFEDLAATVDLAFVLLTPDDPPADPYSSDLDKRRARQNVILELGYFLGAFGRRSGRVFLLYKGPLELPSDLSGVVYVDICNGIGSASDQLRREIRVLSTQTLPRR